jgi:hypothetical protein
MLDHNRCRAIGFAVAVALLLSPAAVAGKKKDVKGEYAVTEAELQAELMSYADRYASIVAQSMNDVEELQPTLEARPRISADLVYSAAAAFTIAADNDPQIALLDMVVMATLGRVIFEEHWKPRYGELADPVITALGTLEQDVWQIAGGILTADQRAELRSASRRSGRRTPG